MKNIVCPVSNEKIPENLPRITAFFVTTLFVLFLITGFLPLAVFLAFDFFARGFNYPEISPLYHSSKVLVQLTGKSQKLIDKAPKLFAARIGFLISLLILVFAGLDLYILANSLTILIITFSFLEWALNLCMGCILYSWIVLPISKQVE